MSIEKQTDSTNGTFSAHAQNGAPLTTANLDSHERNTSTVSTNQKIRDWLTGSETFRRRNVDMEAWLQLVGDDPVAAAIEAATQTGDQGKGN